MSQANVEIVRRLYEASNKEGLWAVAESADPEVEFAPPPDRPELPVLRGVERIREIARHWAGALARQEWLREALATPENWWIRVDHVIDAPQDKVVVLSHLCGTRRGSGPKVELELNRVYTVAQGQITRVEGYLTRKETLEAAGLRE
jgi:ketosteroid isomerase-like protein